MGNPENRSISDRGGLVMVTLDTIYNLVDLIQARRSQTYKEEMIDSLVDQARRLGQDDSNSLRINWLPREDREIAKRRIKSGIQEWKYYIGGGYKEEENT